MDILKCPKCGSTHSIKHGIVKNRQRYTCKECKYNYTVSKLGKELEKIYIIRSLQLYLEGLGFRSISRVIGISHVTIINWIKKYGKGLEFIRIERDKEAIVEVDEIYSFVGSKKNEYGSGLLLKEGVKKYWVLK
jgi:transposase-like protein